MHADSLPGHPTRHVPLEYPGAPRGSGALELAAPLALGQRGLVISPQRSGGSTVLRWLARAVLASEPDARLHAVLVDRPVEEQLDWREELPEARLHATTSDDGPDDHAALTTAFDAARSDMASGHVTIVLVDTFGALVRALSATHDLLDKHVLDGGVPAAVIAELRRLFGMARPGSPGSLTVIGVAHVDTSQPMDEVVLHELVATGNVEWRLDAAALQAGLFPPIDIMASGARRSELVIGEAQVVQRSGLRALLDERGVIAGLDLLLQELPGVDGVDEVADRYMLQPDAPVQEPPLL